MIFNLRCEIAIFSFSHSHIFKFSHYTGFNTLFFNISHVFHSRASKESLHEELLESDKQARKAAGPVPYVKVGHIPEHKVNELLDKISEQGMQSLSPEEKETLLRASREQEPEN